MADDQKDLAPDPTTLPGGANFDVDNASDADYKKHVKILERRKEVADLTPTTAPAGQPAAPSSFTAPSAPLHAYHDSETKLVQHLPEKLYNVLSDEDKARLTPVAEKPEPLKTNG